MRTKLKIVHLEDVSSDAALVSMNLKKAGLDFEMVVVDTREEFIAALELINPDLILSDHTLPAFNSSEALNLVKQAKLDIPFILVTATVTDEFGANIIKQGASDYILKDRIERLPTAIENALEKFRLKRERKEFLKHLKKSEHKFRSLIENSLEVVVIFNAGFKPVYVSPSIGRVLGYSEEETTELSLMDILHPEDKEPVLRTLAKCLSLPGVSIQGREGRIKHKDGTWRWMESVLTNMLHDPVINGVVDNFRDITERKLAEEKLIKSEEKYKLLFQFGPLPSWIFDLKTYQIMDVNQAAINHYGYTYEEFLKLTIKDIRPVCEVEETIRKIEASILTDSIIQFGTFNHLKKDQTIIKVEVSGYKLNFNHRPCIMVVCNDITEKEDTLQKLKNEEAKLLTAQKISKMGYWELNLTDNSFYWTSEVYNIWGRARNQFKPTLANLLETIHPEDQAFFEEQQSEASIGLKPLDIEYRIVLPDGSVKWVHDRGNLVYDEKGEPTAFEGTVQDVTERKLALEKLRRSEARHRGLLHSQTNYVIRTDLAGNYSYCNNKFLADFGWLYPDMEIIGVNSRSSVKEYHHQRIIETVEKCLANLNTVFQVEIDKPKAGGGIKTTLWDFICLTDSKGNPSEIQCMGLDISDRIAAENALKENVHRYELVSRATSDAIWEWDIKTDSLHWGGGVKALLGYDLEADFPDVLTWTDNLHPDDTTRVIEEIDSLINSNENTWKSEYSYRKANGEYAYVEDSGFVIRDESGNAIRMVGAMRDISEKKKLEKLLNRASELARIGTFEADLVNNKLYWSEMTKEIHEVGQDFVPDIETAINFYKPGRDRELITQVVNLAMQCNVPFDEELIIVTAKGNERWVRAIGDTECKNGVCIKFFGSFQDIDKMKRTEIAAQEALLEKNTILESIGDGFFTVDKSWKVTYWNAKAGKLLNCPKEKIIGKNLWDIFPEAIGSDFDINYQKAVARHEIQHFEAFHTVSEKWFDVNAYPSEAGLSIYFQDITKRKEADIELQKLNASLQHYTHELVKTNKEMEQFSYIVSHNLRAPVANIIGLSDLMTKETLSANVKEQFLKGMILNVKRLDEVILDLNTILRVKKDVEEKKELVHLPQLITDIEASIKNVIRKEKVKLETDFSQVSEFFTLKTYLHSIFYNLISNSIKFRRPGVQPVIQIKSFKQDNRLRISFKDNSSGIDLERKGGEVFGLYKRFHPAIEGKGMGLFMVKTQVGMLGGSIVINSEVNRGTEFILEFELKN